MRNHHEEIPIALPFIAAAISWIVLRIKTGGKRNG